MMINRFGLREEPFQITASDRTPFASTEHQEAFNGFFLALIARKRVLALIGETGIGKTTLLRSLIRHVEADGAVVLAATAAPDMAVEDLMLAAGSDFDGHETRFADPADDIETIVASVEERLEQAGTGVLVIDEAQNLDVGTLCDLVDLATSDTETGRFLQVLLSGDYTLERMLADPNLAAALRTMGVVHYLPPLDREEVELFIGERLRRSGAQRTDIFEPSAIDLATDLSGGLPSVLNALCARALRVADEAGESRVTRAFLHSAAESLGIETAPDVDLDIPDILPAEVPEPVRPRSAAQPAHRDSPRVEPEAPPPPPEHRPRPDPRPDPRPGHHDSATVVAWPDFNPRAPRHPDAAGAEHETPARNPFGPERPVRSPSGTPASEPPSRPPAAPRDAEDHDAMRHRADDRARVPQPDHQPDRQPDRQPFRARLYAGHGEDEWADNGSPGDARADDEMAGDGQAGRRSGRRRAVWLAAGLMLAVATAGAGLFLPGGGLFDEPRDVNAVRPPAATADEEDRMPDPPGPAAPQPIERMAEADQPRPESLLPPEPAQPSAADIETEPERAPESTADPAAAPAEDPATPAAVAASPTPPPPAPPVPDMAESSADVPPADVPPTDVPPAEVTAVPAPAIPEQPDAAPPPSSAAPETNEATARIRAAVNFLLAQADRQIGEKLLTTPEGNNAFETYQRIINLDPGSAEAARIRERIKETYENWAETAQSRGEIDAARRFYERALIVDPDDARFVERLNALNESAAVPEPVEDVPDEPATQTAEAPQPQPRSDQVLRLPPDYSDAESGDAGSSGQPRSAAPPPTAETLRPAPEPEPTVAANAFRTRNDMLEAIGQPDMLRAVIEAGRDLDQELPDGKTALMLAAERGRNGAVSMLLNAGAAPNARSRNGGTALMYAASVGDNGSIQALIRHGGAVNAMNVDGKTALMAAAQAGHTETVRLLLNNGADVNTRSVQGRTALDYASESGNGQIVTLLRLRDAQPSSGDNPGTARNDSPRPRPSGPIDLRAFRS
ncbi:MAG TPA: ankyrin repeat domain-containing protein [Arenibaculum sp.]|nr:ankyrin repeat domain-containing protein [Arenibaculum sp.]